MTNEKINRLDYIILNTFMTKDTKTSAQRQYLPHMIDTLTSRIQRNY